MGLLAGACQGAGADHATALGGASLKSPVSPQPDAVGGEP